MARPPDPKTPFRVGIHTIRGYRYASTQERLVNPKTGQKIRRHVHWGSVDRNNCFIPGTRYLMAPEEIRQRLIFPPDWDLREVRRLARAAEANARRQGLAAGGMVRFCGDVWLLEQLAGDLKEDLRQIFPGIGTVTSDLLTLAIFPLCTQGTPFSRVTGWQRVTRTSCSAPLTTRRIREILSSVTDAQKKAFFRARLARGGTRIPLEIAAGPGVRPPCTFAEALFAGPAEKREQPPAETRLLLCEPGSFRPLALLSRPGEDARPDTAGLGLEGTLNAEDLPEGEGREACRRARALLEVFCDGMTRLLWDGDLSAWEAARAGRDVLCYLTRCLGWRLSLRDPSGALLDEMRPVLSVSPPEGEELMAPFTERQREICRLLDLSAPPAPARNTRPRKGRPRKKAASPAAGPDAPDGRA